jgi:hypothetical protein
VRWLGKIDQAFIYFLTIFNKNQLTFFKKHTKIEAGMEITIRRYCDSLTVNSGGFIFFSSGIEFATTIKQQRSRLAVLPLLSGAPLFSAPVLRSHLNSRGCHSC